MDIRRNTADGCIICSCSSLLINSDIHGPLRMHSLNFDLLTLRVYICHTESQSLDFKSSLVHVLSVKASYSLCLKAIKAKAIFQNNPFFF